jgi:hypothetical protein
MLKHGSSRKLAPLMKHLRIRQLVDLIESYTFTPITLDPNFQKELEQQFKETTIDQIAIKELKKKDLTRKHIKSFPQDIKELYYYDYEAKGRSVLLCKNSYNLHLIYISNKIQVRYNFMIEYDTKVELYIYMTYEGMMGALSKYGITIKGVHHNS